MEEKGEIEMISWKKVMSILLVALLLQTCIELPHLQETKAKTKAEEKAAATMNLHTEMTTRSLDEVPAGYTAIRTIADLYAIRNNLSGKYILMNDIDLSQATAPGGAYDTGNGWTPIRGRDGEPFEGVLDGNGYHIKGMHIYGEIKRSVGLFESCDGDTSVIRNLGMVDVDINVTEYKHLGYRGYCSVGAFAGYAPSSEISNCFVGGKITAYGVYRVGGISGTGGIIKNCYSSVHIETSNKEYRDVEAMGGIFGWAQYNNRVNNIYNCGVVNGGLGNSIGEEDENGYYYTYSNGYYLQGTGVQNAGTALTEAQMRNSSFFTGFDFKNIWMIDELSSYPYPQLRACPQVRIKNLELTSLPAKRIYAQGDKLDMSGGVLSITYEDGVTTSTVLDNSMISGADMNQPGKQTLTVNYLNGTCSFDIEVQKVEASSIELSKTSMSLNRNAKSQLKAVIKPSNTTDKSVQWESDNEVVATVTKKGVVRGINAGSATITATTSNGLTASCKVTVKIPAKSIKLNKQKITLKRGKKKTIKATVNPLETTDTIQWSSSNTKVATVSNGVIKAKKKGNATIMAKTSSGKKAYVKVTVK